MNEPVTPQHALSCADDYDPNSMPVDKAREVIARFLTPVTRDRARARARRARARARRGRDLAARRARARQLRDGRLCGALCRSEERRRSDAEGRRQRVRRRAVRRTLRAGQAVRIMTGGVVPPGADTIVMQEHVKAQDGQVTIGGGHRKGQNLRKAGEDLAAGQVALKRGIALRPADIGLIASLGIGEVAVYRRLRVAFFSTGDELVSIGTQPARRPDLRQQPLHDLRHARRAWAAKCSTWAWCATTRSSLERAFSDAAARGGRRDHERRRFRRRSRFREGSARQAGRSRVLEDRDEARPPARLRQDRRRPLLRPARATRSR